MWKLPRRLLPTLAAIGLCLIAAPLRAQVPPPVPALPDSTRLTQYSISASTCACSVNFALYGSGTDIDNWIEVWVGGTRYLSTDSSFGWSLSSATGSLATIPRPITNAIITFNAVQTGTVLIVGAERPRRLAQFTENRGVAARDLNQTVTDLVVQNREQWDLLQRALRGAPGDVIGLLPGAAARAGGFLCWDGTGAIPLACAPGNSTGNVSGPNSAVDGHFAQFNGTTGRVLKDGGVLSFGSLSGNIATSQMNSGSSASGTTFFRGDGTWAVPSSALIPNYLSSLTISNDNSGANIANDLAVAAGIATDSTNVQPITLAAALSQKHINVAWATGTNAGCLDTGAVANSTYWIFLILQTSGGSNVDVLCSLSPSAPTMPTNYTLKRRIGGVIRVAGANVLFLQDGNHFSLNTPVQEINGVDPGAITAITRTLTGVPIGVRVLGYFTHGNTTVGAGANTNVWLSDLAVADVVPSSTSNNLSTSTASTISSSTVQVFTNASGQVRSRHSARDANTLYSLVTRGWDDTRGQ